MKSSRPMRQHGAALLIMVTIVGLGATWYLVSRLNTESGMANAAAKARNQKVLNTAKAALIGYVAAQAVKAGENRPGALPCPEAPADFNVAASEGTVSYPCTLPIVGRFPWRTLGLDKLVDASGEPLWYAIATGWAGANTVINSDCASSSSGMACATGRLTVDGATNDVIALIIAPGPRLNVSTSANCAAWSQARTTTGSPDARNYLECQNATWPADASFATTGPSSSFNDQIVTITVADVLPGIEAAVAARIQREILPALETVYIPATWGVTGANRILPFAVPFASPGPGAGTSNYRGASATYAGLLPFNQTQNCTESASNPRCTTATTGGTAFLVFSKVGNDTQTAGAGSIRTQSTCSWSSTTYVCTGEYNDTTISLRSTFNVTNVAMGLRKLDYSKVSVTAMNDVAGGIGTQTIPFTAATVLNADGSATMTILTGALPVVSDVAVGWGSYASYRVSIDRAAFGDHVLLDPSDPDTGWFVRNEWFRQSFYAVAHSNTSTLLPAERSCTSAADCLTLTTGAASSNKSALVILAGRSINGNARPSSTLADYLEFGNRTGGYETQTITGAVASAYTDTGSANAYSVVAPVTIGRPFAFKAVNANSGASTLAATGVSATNLVNADGSSLSASQIQAGAVSEVAYDGTRFRLYKRPFNDRVTAIGSN